MRLYTETHGKGVDLVMLHGWGMHSAIWGECLERLMECYRITLVDLPGHGRSPTLLGGQEPISSLTAAVAEAVPPRAIWVGWSLGGLVALYAALEFSERVTKLVLVATNPCFVSRPDWPWAQGEEILEGFATDLRRDHREVLLRFLALQVRGSDAARRQLRVMRERLFLHGEPDPIALDLGLTLLKQCDLRQKLSSVEQPTLLVAGERDLLVPPRAVAEMAERLPEARLEVLAGAGHAPFLSSPKRFCKVLESFVDG